MLLQVQHDAGGGGRKAARSATAASSPPVGKGRRTPRSPWPPPTQQHSPQVLLRLLLLLRLQKAMLPAQCGAGRREFMFESHACPLPAWRVPATGPCASPAHSQAHTPKAGKGGRAPAVQEEAAAAGAAWGLAGPRSPLARMQPHLSAAKRRRLQSAPSADEPAAVPTRCARHPAAVPSACSAAALTLFPLTCARVRTRPEACGYRPHRHSTLRALLCRRSEILLTEGQLLSGRGSTPRGLESCPLAKTRHLNAAAASHSPGPAGAGCRRWDAWQAVPATGHSVWTCTAA